MEVAPVLIVLLLLWLTPSPLSADAAVSHADFLFHALILIFGGMYSHARVPLGFEVQQWLDLIATRTTNWGISSRIGAGSGGARDPPRGGYVQGRKMLGFVGCIALAISGKKGAYRVVGGAGVGPGR